MCIIHKLPPSTTAACTACNCMCIHHYATAALHQPSEHAYMARTCAESTPRQSINHRLVCVCCTAYASAYLEISPQRSRCWQQPSSSNVTLRLFIIQSASTARQETRRWARPRKLLSNYSGGNTPQLHVHLRHSRSSSRVVRH